MRILKSQTIWLHIEVRLEEALFVAEVFTIRGLNDFGVMSSVLAILQPLQETENDLFALHNIYVPRQFEHFPRIMEWSSSIFSVWITAMDYPSETDLDVSIMNVYGNY